MYKELSWSPFSKGLKLLGKMKDDVDTVMVDVKKDDSVKEVVCNKIYVFVCIWSSERLKIS